MATLAPLPVYPSAQARQSFTASQIAQFHLNVSNALAQVISLPPDKRDTPATRAFLSSYASNAAHQILQNFIWENADPVKGDERVLRQRVLMLAERLAGSSPGLDTKILLDLCVAFPSNTTRLKVVFVAALAGTPALPSIFTADVVPAFSVLLRPAQSSGLHGLGKTARCLISLLRACPPELIRPFAHSKDFILALARAYDEGLYAIARSYGGIRIDSERRTLDDWERVWLQTKVDMVDSFRILITGVLKNISVASGTQLAAEADRAFGTMFALLDITPQYAQPPSTSAISSDPSSSVPFLNRSLVADYQHAYDLKTTLASALRSAAKTDDRMPALETILRSFDVQSSSTDGTKEPGALKLLLRSSGMAYDLSRKPTPGVPVSKSKGKEKATFPDSARTAAQDLDLDLKITQILDIFPDQSPDYLRKLLAHPSYPFHGSAEKVIAALLEGNAPDEDTLTESFPEDFEDIGRASEGVDAPIERRNIFDDQSMDLERVRYGKKRQDGATLIRDRAEVDRMKADILRRTENMSIDSDDEEGGQQRSPDVMYLDDDFDTGGRDARVIGDGETSGDEQGGEEKGPEPPTPETVLELAYIRDPKLFDRDAETRRSKVRSELKAQTGWTDEQIEGWRIMLERNPKKDRVLQKHEFSGNRTDDGPVTVSGSGSDRPRGGSRGRGGGRGRGRGGDRGRGTGGAPGQSRDTTARERAFKDKHKGSNANHNRKRGHTKKMARASAGPSG
ncbi:hypothetical protein F5I97DRAFT_2019936 [Phlebopus sp. FC_14]|nr:hypothetical protein F5I97DRAFT_2019936 [Phlebopus sp. FC_14]